MKSMWNAGTNFGINNPELRRGSNFFDAFDYELLERNEGTLQETTLETLEEISNRQGTQEAIFGKRKVSRKLI